MLIDYVLLLILTFLPIYYIYSFWLNILESEEYNLNLFKEVLKSKEWKNVIFNFWFLLEISILFLSSLLIINPPFEVIYYNMFFYFLILENIFVLWKIFRKKLLKPTFSKINIFIILILITFFCLDLLIIYYTNILQILYPFLMLILILSPIIIRLIAYVILQFNKK